MKQYTTNNIDTFVEVSVDCPATSSEIPPTKEPKTSAQIEYEMLIDNPYKYTSDDVLYKSNGERRDIKQSDFFSKGQPCFRCSALAKRYGWGIHSNKDSKIAIYGIETTEYKRLASDENIKHVKAMRSRKK